MANSILLHEKTESMFKELQEKWAHAESESLRDDIYNEADDALKIISEAMEKVKNLLAETTTLFEEVGVITIDNEDIFDDFRDETLDLLQDALDKIEEVQCLV